MEFKQLSLALTAHCDPAWAGRPPCALVSCCGSRAWLTISSWQLARPKESSCQPYVLWSSISGTRCACLISRYIFLESPRVTPCSLFVTPRVDWHFSDTVPLCLLMSLPRPGINSLPSWILCPHRKYTASSSPNLIHCTLSIKKLLLLFLPFTLPQSCYFSSSPSFISSSFSSSPSFLSLLKHGQSHYIADNYFYIHLSYFSNYSLLEVQYYNPWSVLQPSGVNSDLSKASLSLGKFCLLKIVLSGWRDGPALKRTGCSCGGPELGS